MLVMLLCVVIGFTIIIYNAAASKDSSSSEEGQSEAVSEEPKETATPTPILTPTPVPTLTPTPIPDPTEEASDIDSNPPIEETPETDFREIVAQHSPDEIHQALTDQGAKALTDKWTATGRYYDMDNGKELVMLSVGPVNYLDENKTYQPIDNTVIPDETRSSYAFTNASNAFSAYFPAKSSATSNVLFVAPNAAEILIGNQSEIWYTNTAGESSLLCEDNEVAGISDDNIIRYEKRYPDITEEYLVSYGGIRRNLVLDTLPSLIEGKKGGTLELREIVTLPEGYQFSIDGIVQSGSFATQNDIHVLDFPGILGRLPDSSCCQNFAARRRQV